MPASWSEKKKAEMDGRPHQQKPDLSNLVKAFEDALTDNDQSINLYREVKKIWGKYGKIVIHIPE